MSIRLLVFGLRAIRMKIMLHFTKGKKKKIIYNYTAGEAGFQTGPWTIDSIVKHCIFHVFDQVPIWELQLAN